VIVVIAATLGGGGGDDDGGGSRGGLNPARHAQRSEDRKPVPKTYEVKSGDTLTSIAHETGVPVARIVRLNPGVDPQILVSGEELKLR
jgi:LysM repeat protein